MNTEKRKKKKIWLTYGRVFEEILQSQSDSSDIISDLIRKNAF